MSTPARRFTPTRLFAPTRVFALVSAALVAVLATPAMATADAPVTWETEEGLDWMGYFLLIVGIPAGLVVVFVLFSLAVHRKHFVPAEPGTEIHVATGGVEHH